MITHKRRLQGKACLGCKTIITVDRPVGSVNANGSTCTVNYGYMSVNGEKIRAFVLGKSTPISEFEGVVIAVIYHKHDNENRLVVAGKEHFNQVEIAEMIAFEQKDHPYKMDCLYEKSCGAVLFCKTAEGIRFVVMRDKAGYCGLAKGHVEKGESEKETALREIWEETSIKASIYGDFRRETTFTMRNGVIKTVVYFMAEFSQQTPKNNEGFEKHTHLLLDFEHAYNLLTFYNTRELLREAYEILLAEESK